MNLDLLVSVHSITSLEDERERWVLSDNTVEGECLEQVFHHIILCSLYRGLDEM